MGEAPCFFVFFFWVFVVEEMAGVDHPGYVEYAAMLWLILGSVVVWFFF